MAQKKETASRAGLTGSVVWKAIGTAPHYQNVADQATTDYAAAKVATRFRLRIETARLICTLSGIGGAQ